MAGGGRSVEVEELWGEWRGVACTGCTASTGREQGGEPDRRKPEILGGQLDGQRTRDY